LDFENRLCICGCSRTFKCLKSSTQKYASRDCFYLKLTPEERRKSKIKETYAALHGRSTNYTKEKAIV